MICCRLCLEGTGPAARCVRSGSLCVYVQRVKRAARLAKVDRSSVDPRARCTWHDTHRSRSRTTNCKQAVGSHGGAPFWSPNGAGIDRCPTQFQAPQCPHRRSMRSRGSSTRSNKRTGAICARLDRARFFQVSDPATRTLKLRGPRNARSFASAASAAARASAPRRAARVRTGDVRQSPPPSHPMRRRRTKARRPHPI